MRCLIALSLFTGCAHAGPDLHGKLWAGASAADGIQRAQDAKVMKCSEPAMDQYVCLKYDDLKAYKGACQTWY